MTNLDLDSATYWCSYMTYFTGDIVRLEDKFYRLENGDGYRFGHDSQSNNEQPDKYSWWKEITPEKRKVNIYKPRVRFSKGVGWWCSSFMNSGYGETPEQAYSRWKEKELQCSGKQRMRNMVNNTLKSLDEHKKNVEVVEWELESGETNPIQERTYYSLPNTSKLLSKVIKWFKGYL